MAEAPQINPHAAVSIEPRAIGCCDAAREIAGRRYLIPDAPQLPLKDCNRFDQCQCKYKKWDDRRHDERRAMDSGISNQYFHGAERRTKKRGRRSTDQE